MLEFQPGSSPAAGGDGFLPRFGVRCDFVGFSGHLGDSLGRFPLSQSAARKQVKARWDIRDPGVTLPSFPDG